jgi:hypothetical protein
MNRRGCSSHAVDRLFHGLSYASLARYRYRLSEPALVGFRVGSQPLRLEAVEIAPNIFLRAVQRPAVSYRHGEAYGIAAVNDIHVCHRLGASVTHRKQDGFT